MEAIKKLTVNDLYISPFTARRVYNEDGVMSYVPIERNTKPTGQGIIDRLAQEMATGNTDHQRLALIMGCTREEFSGFIRVMTGMSFADFRRQYIFRFADDLLRYTDLSVDKIARRIGAYSASSLCQQFVEYRHFTPKQRRIALQQPRDAGRYRM
jgi:AraC-like DNA-binding protein